MYKDCVIPIGRNRPGDKLKVCRGVILHYIGNIGTTAEQNRQYMMNTERYASAHDIVDLNGDIYHIIPYDEVAWHVGRTDGKYTLLKNRLCGDDNPNYYLIGIELTHPDASAKPTDETRKATVNLCAEILGQHGLTTDDLFLHTEIVGEDYKECHLYYWRHPDEWARLKQDIHKLMIPEITVPNDICWELGQRGLISDVDGMIKEMEENPDSRLYWLGRKIVNIIGR